MSLLDHCPDMLTVSEAADILRADPSAVDELIQTGEITFAEIAGKILIPKQYLELV